MTVQNITLMGHPVLMTPAGRVVDPTAPEVAALVRDMADTMQVAGGIGIAAPQIGVGKRVVIFYTPPNTAAGDSTDSSLREDLTKRPLTVLINPEVEILTTERVTGWEGCLSVPGMRGMVPRAPRIRYRGQDLEGRLIEREAHGFHAVVVQHECDHLDGILYPQRMTDLGTLQFVGAAEGGSYAPTGNPSDRNIEMCA
ncbi:peptide deformylase [Govanella unica]|uniref:Peptide deformylase n=1 Tax=Govanella unica TaxID=2975056 RepID=A0A9X3Z877_9PROT|nr:peptide deformylase [Govania unica]MDA5194866.1 peptide deformylase [Govania unica]